MKFIEDIRDRHKGEEIWVIGAGSSLDEYPVDFFKDKICIGVNWVFSVFVYIRDKQVKFRAQVFYSVHEHREPADWIAKHKPLFLKHCFFLLPPERRDGGGHRDFRMIWWEDYNEDPYYMRWGLKGHMAVSASDQDFKDVAKCIAKGGNCCYVCRGTTIHWAIQAAAVLGAKKIYVVGAEAKGAYVRGHGSMYKNRKPTKDHPHWRAGTEALVKAFKPYGIEIVLHRYDRGEQQL